MRRKLDKVLVADIESTCWETKEEQGSKPNEVIEIGICEVHLASNSIQHKRSYPVRPRFTEISPFCTSLTGWTQEQLDQADDIAVVLKNIRNDYQITREMVWLSFGDYDRVKLSSPGPGGLRDLYGIQHEDNPFAMMASHLNIKMLMALKERLKKELGMARALEYYKLPLEGRHHNGADDAFNIAKIVLKVLS